MGSKMPNEDHHDVILNKLETTPTPNKNGSYETKGGGSYAIFWRSICHIFCRNPLILTDFYAIRTPILWHILGAYFLQIWGGGVVRIIFRFFRGCTCIWENGFDLPFSPLLPAILRQRNQDTARSASRSFWNSFPWSFVLLDKFSLFSLVSSVVFLGFVNGVFLVFSLIFGHFPQFFALSLLESYHWTENYYITSRYFSELIMSDVM